MFNHYSELYLDTLTPLPPFLSDDLPPYSALPVVGDPFNCQGYHDEAFTPSSSQDPSPLSFCGDLPLFPMAYDSTSDIRLMMGAEAGGPLAYHPPFNLRHDDPTLTIYPPLPGRAGLDSDADSNSLGFYPSWDTCKASSSATGVTPELSLLELAATARDDDLYSLEAFPSWATRPASSSATGVTPELALLNLADTDRDDSLGIFSSWDAFIAPSATGVINPELSCVDPAAGTSRDADINSLGIYPSWDACTASSATEIANPELAQIARAATGPTRNIRQTSKNIQATEARRKRPAKFGCEFCESTFTTRYRLKEHRNVHLGIKQRCSFCSYASSYGGDVKRHLASCQKAKKALELETRYL